MLQVLSNNLYIIIKISNNPIMNMTKKINVNFSSLVGLKAELLRKQVEVNETKLKTESINPVPLLNKKRSKKITADDAGKNTKETVDLEDIAMHKKSKLSLEAKTRLYNKLKKSKNDDNKFLVDFKNKLDEPDEEFVDEKINEEHPIEPEENWVEYQDCFGRTRKCLREDLPDMQKKDELIKQEVMKRNTDENRKEIREQYPIQEKEPEIEIMRRKWEEQTKKLADKVDIHYQDILFDEARTHGVGYYAFSQDREERTKQQENLATLRKETERKQKEMKEVKELKEKMEQNRLKAARIRQRIRAGLPAELTEEELAQKNKLINFTNNINTNKDNNECVEKDKSSKETDHKSTNVKQSEIIHKKENNDEDKIKAFEELLDKKAHSHVMSQEEWVYKQRAQRIREFGPIYDNFRSTGFYNLRNVDEQLTHKDNEEFNNTEPCNSQKSVEESNINLQNHEDSNDFTSKEINFGTKNIYNNQNDKDSIARYENPTIKNSMGHKLIENATKPTLNSTMSLSNLLPSQKQAIVSHSLLHLSNNYSQSMCDNLGIHTSEQSILSNDINIPLSNEDNITSSTCNDNSIQTSKQEALQQSLNEDRIMAGLKYLREKFEENHSK